MVQTFEQCIFYLLEFKNIFLKICKIVFFYLLGSPDNRFEDVWFIMSKTQNLAASSPARDFVYYIYSLPCGTRSGKISWDSNKLRIHGSNIWTVYFLCIGIEKYVFSWVAVLYFTPIYKLGVKEFTPTHKKGWDTWVVMKLVNNGIAVIC